MKVTKLLFLTCFAFLCWSFSCDAQEKGSQAQFKLDHIVIFSTNETIEESLQQGILRRGDKLSNTHKNQGTYSNYYIVLNSFIEFLYLNDSLAVQKNEKRFRSKYSQRWVANDTICPFAFGLTLSPFDTTQTSFPLLTYQSLDSPQGDYYLMSAYNVDNKQPLLYTSTPNRAYPKLDSIGQVEQQYEAMVREDFRAYLTHPSQIKNLSKLIITLPQGVEGKNIELLNSLEDVSILYSDHYSLTMIFDHGKAGKEVSFNEGFDLTIKY